MRLQKIENREVVAGSLMEIWEKSVRATHFFLIEKDIVTIRPSVEKGLQEVEKLFIG